MFQTRGSSGMIFSYDGPDTSGKQVVPKNALSKNAGLPAINNINAGLVQQAFYFTQGDKVPALMNSFPSAVRSVGFINYPSTGNKWPGLSVKDHFAVRWTGSLNIQTAGDYMFKLQSDGGSVLWIGTNLLISNEGSHGMKFETGTIHMPSGATAMRIDMLQKDGGGGCAFFYKGPDSGNSEKVVPKRAFLRNSNIRGLLVEVFSGGPKNNKMPDLSIKPKSVGTASSVNYASVSKIQNWGMAPFSTGDFREVYAVRWSGSVRVIDGGIYTFYIKSDDGSILWMDNKVLVDNDGTHGMKEKSGTQEFADAEEVNVRIDYFQNTGAHGMIFCYEGADTSNQKMVVGDGNRGELSRIAGNPKY
jgi:hypothetical protein